MRVGNQHLMRRPFYPPVSVSALFVPATVCGFVLERTGSFTPIFQVHLRAAWPLPIAAGHDVGGDSGRLPVLCCIQTRRQWQRLQRQPRCSEPGADGLPPHAWPFVADHGGAVHPGHSGLEHRLPHRPPVRLEQHAPRRAAGGQQKQQLGQA